MAGRGGRANRGRGARNYANMHMVEELRNEIRNLAQLVIENNRRNDGDRQADQPQLSSEEDGDDSSVECRLNRGRAIPNNVNNERPQGWEDCIVRALQSSKDYGV